jgi:lipid-A-disaccharide synthase
MSSAAADTKRVLIVAGEASGDLHGGNLLRAAANLYPSLDFYGVGGAQMRAAGCELLFPAEDLAVMGLSEVIGHLPTILRRFNQLKTELAGPRRPDLLLLIDYPGFNLRLAARAHQLGIPVLYYIAPKVWAWKKGRIKTIGQVVDRLAVIFPFEPALYAAEPVHCRYVGNPLLDEYLTAMPLEDLRPRLGVAADRPLIGLFPGSRSSEIRYNFATLLQTARQILARKPAARFIVPVASSLKPAEFEKKLAAYQLPVELSQDSIYAVAAACDVVLCVSGTVTLQTALCRTPMVVIYRAARLSYLVGRLLVKIPHFSLVNIVAQRQVVREFLQQQANPQALAAELLRLLDDTAYRLQVVAGLDDVCQRLGDPGCSVRVAAMAAQMCNEGARS